MAAKKQSPNGQSGSRQQRGSGSTEKKGRTGSAATQATVEAPPSRAGARRSRSARSAKTEKPDLQSTLRQFASEHPDGWSHDQWLDLLHRIDEQGYDTGDTNAVGRSLERERLRVKLEGISGMGPRRVDALVDRFETLWSLRQANAEQIAELPSVPRNIAERVVEQVR